MKTWEWSDNIRKIVIIHLKEETVAKMIAKILSMTVPAGKSILMSLRKLANLPYRPYLDDSMR